MQIEADVRLIYWISSFMWWENSRTKSIIFLVKVSVSLFTLLIVGNTWRYFQETEDLCPVPPWLEGFFFHKAKFIFIFIIHPKMFPIWVITAVVVRVSLSRLFTRIPNKSCKHMKLQRPRVCGCNKDANCNRMMLRVETDGSFNLKKITCYNVYKNISCLGPVYLCLHISYREASRGMNSPRER